MSLFFRALVAFLVLPGTVAFAIPLLLLRPNVAWLSFDTWGVFPAAAGIVLLAWCVGEFYVAGKGTLAPWSPPKALVITGLYRYSRNPMYVAVLLILAGWALGYRSIVLAIYMLAVMAAFGLRVVLYEEPWLLRTFGAEWLDYKSRVPRWLGVR